MLIIGFIPKRRACYLCDVMFKPASAFFSKDVSIKKNISNMAATCMLVSTF